MAQVTLTEFLLARIADEEHLAHDAASEGTPHRTGWQLWTSKVDTTPGGELLGPRGSVEASPSRVLAECEAKRAAIRAAQVERRALERNEGAIPGNLSVICALALPYSDHPDYLPEWKRWRLGEECSEGDQGGAEGEDQQGTAQ